MSPVLGCLESALFDVGSIATISRRFSVPFLQYVTCNNPNLVVKVIYRAYRKQG